MNTLPKSHRKSAGFTLVEMIGVLAVIAILASMLVPRVFQAIGDSKVNNAASAVNSIKSAVAEYYGKYGRIGGTGGTNLGLAENAIQEDWDKLALLPEGFCEKPFSVRIGSGEIGAPNGSRLRVINIYSNTASDAPATAATDLDVGAYNLDGSTNSATINDVLGQLLVEAVIKGVDNQDAKDLNDRIDGPSLGAPLGASDTKGRVKYFVDQNTGAADVRIYVAHK